MQLVIGNKNYSSWSMRPWVLMRQLGLAFDEVKLRFDFAPDSPFRRAVARFSPAGRVPVLVDEGFAVWDSLAIVEYLHERFPDRGVWPAAAQDRARARSLAAEMHAGFGALRSAFPMNIETMWAQALAASGGPFLFGAFSAADAFYAPVCMRLRTYALPLVESTRRYVDRVSSLPGVAAWIEDALAEQDFLDFDEPYRTHR